MADYTSNHGQILLALEALVKSLNPTDLAEEEVQIRGDWRIHGQPIRGITLHELGEMYHEGTMGTQDIGYLCAIVFVQHDDGDARLSGDGLQAWRELIRRRLTDQRIPITITNATDPSEHVAKVLKSGEVLNAAKYAGYDIRRIVVAVWLREVNPI